MNEIAVRAAHAAARTAALLLAAATGATLTACALVVVTERSVACLMGPVTTDEGGTAGRIAASTSGVARVLKVFECAD